MSSVAVPRGVGATFTKRCRIFAAEELINTSGCTNVPPGRLRVTATVQAELDAWMAANNFDIIDIVMDSKSTPISGHGGVWYLAMCTINVTFYEPRADA